MFEKNRIYVTYEHHRRISTIEVDSKVMCYINSLFT